VEQGTLWWTQNKLTGTDGKKWHACSRWCTPDFNVFTYDI